MPEEGKLPDQLVGYVAVRSPASLWNVEPAPERSDPFHSTAEDRAAAAHACEACGLEVQQDSPLGLAVSGPAGAWEELSGALVVKRERLVAVGGARQSYVTHLDLSGDTQPEELGVGVAASAAARIDALVLEEPATAMAPSPLPPTLSRFHLRVPDDVALLLQASRAHRAGQVGEGVRVAMVDTGFEPHPFYTARGYSVQGALTAVSGMDPANDPKGHGTGEAANIFAVAPGATLLPIRASNEQGDLVGVHSGFLMAKAARPRPQIITNSWGYDRTFPQAGAGPAPLPDVRSNAVAAEILDAIEQGITVVFSAGNGQFGLEAQLPGVISAGGAYYDAALRLQASDYSSGYESPWYPGTTVPTVCGLVGMRPRASYLLLPVPPGCRIDVDRAAPFGDDPADGTTADDGWALFSGTSAAAPQIAGAAAVLLGAKPELTPAEVRDALTRTAKDVVRGVSNAPFDSAAAQGLDPATGAGLVDVWAALAAVTQR